MPKSVIMVITGTHLSSDKEYSYYKTSEMKSVFIDHFHCITHLRAEFLRSVAINDSDFNVIFTIYNCDKIASLFVTIGFRDPIYFGPSKAEQDINPALKRRSREVSRQV